MAKATVVPLTDKSQLLFLKYYEGIQADANTYRSEQRARFESIDRQYQRELDLSQEQAKAKAANNAGDPSKFQNMTVPVVMPQVEAAVVHQTSVFLTGFPLFGAVASPEYMDEALQLESVIDNDAARGGWTRELILFFRDCFKYNFSPLEVSWTSEVTHSVETDLAKSTTEGIPKEVIWSGNKIKRLNPYNTFVDRTVSPSDICKSGAHAGYTEYMSRIKLKSFIAALPDKIVGNITTAFESSSEAALKLNADSKSFYLPSINPEVTVDKFTGDTNWMDWAGMDTVKESKINYKTGYDVTTLYVRALPTDFDMKLPAANTPCIFKLIIINHSVIIFAEKQTNAHNLLPIMVGVPLEDGLDYQTKSLAENGIPFQQLASAFMNANIASKRRAISDRVLYDPSRISAAQINSANPSAKIAVRPAAYGKNIADSVYQFPYRDDQSGAALQGVQTVVGMANGLSGQNLAQQGQFVKGNKTLHEFESTMQNANGRDQLASILLESQCFTPLKNILKFNILQYQGGTTIYNRDKDTMVEVDPVKLRKAVLDFKITDGLTPASKLLNSEMFSVALQVLGSSPQIASEYNVGQLFSYMMKTQGAKIDAFEKSPEQVAFEQAMQQWQQVAMEAVAKGANLKELPEVPKPEAFGYDPKGNKPAPKDTNSSEVPTNQEGLPNGDV